MSNEEYNPYRADLKVDRELPQVEKKSRKSRGGCFLYGCLFSILGVLLLGIAVAVGGYYFLKGQATQFTEPDPISMPEVNLSAEEITQIATRFKEFQELVLVGTEEESSELVELVLTAEELNAMIEQNPDLKGRVHIAIDEDQLVGQVSIPTDFIPLLKGRYFNATATFDVSLEEGLLSINLADATVKGAPVPEQYLAALRNENLVKEMNDDPKSSEVIRRLESLEIKEGKIRLLAKPKLVDKEAVPDAEEQPVEEKSN